MAIKIDQMKEIPKLKQSTIEKHEVKEEWPDISPNIGTYPLKCFDCDKWSLFRVADEDLKTTKVICPHCGGDFSYKSKDTCRQ